MTSPESQDSAGVIATGQETPGASVSRARRFDAYGALALALFLIAAFTRFDHLGDRPFHHDESIHAYQSYNLSKDGNWRYDPAYHGPLMYYLNALAYRLAGATNTTARIVPALLGLVLIGFAWPLSRWLGRPAAALYAILVLLSPHFTYFSRFIREDVYSLVFTLGTILAFRMFLDTNRSRWLTLSAVSFALAGVTKENAYMTGVLFVAFGIWQLIEGTITPGTPARAGIRKSMDWLVARWKPVVTAAIVFLAIWATFYSAFGRYPQDSVLAISKAVKYWMGQHAIARIPGPWYYYFPQSLYYETVILFCAPFAFSWRQWRRDPLLRSLLLTTPVFIILFLETWARQDLSGGLLRLLTNGEATSSRPLVILGIAWFLSLILASRILGPPEIVLPPLERFLAFWAASSFVFYAWAREKVPWLTVHPLLPLTILAALGGVNLWRNRKTSGMRLAGVIAVILLAINSSGMFLACFRYGAYDLEKQPKHGEYLAYVQTTWDLVRALDIVETAKSRVPPGQQVITVTGEATWPLSWYLRDTQTVWTQSLETISTPLIVADWDPEGALDKQLQDKYTAHRFPIRAWWFPDDFRKRSMAERFRWWLYHELWSPIGSQDAVLYVRKDLVGTTGMLSPFQFSIRDTTGREYPSEAKTIPAREIGGPGVGPGEFNEPRGIAVDAHGNIYVADTKNSRIEVFDGNGHFSRQFGSKGSGPGQFNEPCGVGVDSQGDIWVADTWNYRIVHSAGDGRVIGTFGGSDSLFGPRAVLAVKGFVYVADTGNKRIVRYDRDGNKVSDWGGPGNHPGQFVEPVGLAADIAGNIFVADTGNHRVEVFDPEGKFERQFPVFGWKDFYTEPYLAIGPSDTVFVTDSWSGRVAQYDQSGNLAQSFKPPQDAKLPTGIAIDPFGRLIVSDRGTHRLLWWALTSLGP